MEIQLKSYALKYFFLEFNQQTVNKSVWGQSVWIQIHLSHLFVLSSVPIWIVMRIAKSLNFASDLQQGWRSFQ